MSNKPWVIMIVGPTAVGKTDLAISIAKSVNAEIISADSRLFYKGMDIGTAKPTPEQQAQMQHYLVDVAEPNEIWSLSMFQSECQQLINEIHQRGKLPMLVGGTGQYFRALVEGWEIPASEPDHSMRDVLERMGNEIGAEALYEKLQLLDPKAAEKIDPQNLRRTVRALEVIFLTGEKFSAQRRKSDPHYNFWIIGLTRPRPELYERIDERIELMFTNGLVEETKKLLDSGIAAENPNMSAIGYREVAQYIRGEISLGEAKMLMKRKTREFVRRQANWFKLEDPNIHWYTMGSDVEQQIIEDLRIAIRE
jgi:tRNA dimethylallyltransferase